MIKNVFQRKISMTRDQFFEFIKKRQNAKELSCSTTQYYLRYFDSYAQTGRITQWNWASAFAPYWLAYRGMILYQIFLCFFTMILYQLLTCLCINDDWHKMYSLLLFVLGVLFFGAFGNYIYLQYANRKVQQGVLRRPPRVVYILVPILLSGFSPTTQIVFTHCTRSETLRKNFTFI